MTMLNLSIFRQSSLPLDSRSVNSEGSTHSVNRIKKPQKKEETKHVQFNDRVRMRKVSSHRCFSEEERSNMWYTTEESKVIRQDAVATVKKMMKGINVDLDEQDSSRGLEFKTPKKNKIRQDRKQDILMAVLIEQETLHCEHGHIDEEFLADVYISCSRPCVLEARRRGQKDEVEANMCNLPDPKEAPR